MGEFKTVYNTCIDTFSTNKSHLNTLSTGFNGFLPIHPSSRLKAKRKLKELAEQAEKEAQETAEKSAESEQDSDDGVAR